MAGSQIALGVIDDTDRVQAFGRVLTDYVFKALLFDVIVAEHQRTTGLGDIIMRAIMEHPKLARVAHLELYCLPELCGFYQRHGFSADTAGVGLMRYTRNG